MHIILVQHSEPNYTVSHTSLENPSLYCWFWMCLCLGRFLTQEKAENPVFVRAQVV